MIELQKLTCRKCGNSTGFLVNEDTVLFDLFIIRDQEKEVTLDKLHALNNCIVSEIDRLMQTMSLHNLIKALDLARSLNMLIPEKLPKGVQEAMNNQRYALINKINKMICDSKLPQKKKRKKKKKKRRKR